MGRSRAAAWRAAAITVLGSHSRSAGLAYTNVARLEMNWAAFTGSPSTCSNLRRYSGISSRSRTVPGAGAGSLGSAFEICLSVTFRLLSDNRADEIHSHGQRPAQQ